MDDRRKDDDIIIDLIRATTEQKATMDYIKQSLDEIKQELKTLKANDRCKDCETTRRLEEHISSSEKQLDRKWVIVGILSAGGIALLGILLQVLKII